MIRRLFGGPAIASALRSPLLLTRASSIDSPSLNSERQSQILSSRRAHVAAHPLESDLSESAESVKEGSLLPVTPFQMDPHRGQAFNTPPVPLEEQEVLSVLKDALQAVSQSSFGESSAVQKQSSENQCIQKDSLRHHQQARRKLESKRAYYTSKQLTREKIKRLIEQDFGWMLTISNLPETEGETSVQLLEQVTTLLHQVPGWTPEVLQAERVDCPKSSRRVVKIRLWRYKDLEAIMKHQNRLKNLEGSQLEVIPDPKFSRLMERVRKLNSLKPERTYQVLGGHIVDVTPTADTKPRSGIHFSNGLRIFNIPETEGEEVFSEIWRVLEFLGVDAVVKKAYRISRRSYAVDPKYPPVIGFHLEREEDEAELLKRSNQFQNSKEFANVYMLSPGEKTWKLTIGNLPESSGETDAELLEKVNLLFDQVPTAVDVRGVERVSNPAQKGVRVLLGSSNDHDAVMVHRDLLKLPGEALANVIPDWRYKKEISALTRARNLNSLAPERNFTVIKNQVVDVTGYWDPRKFRLLLPHHDLSLMIYNIPEQEDEEPFVEVWKILESLGLESTRDVVVRTAERVGRENRPIVITLDKTAQVDAVFQKIDELTESEGLWDIRIHPYMPERIVEPFDIERSIYIHNLSVDLLKNTSETGLKEIIYGILHETFQGDPKIEVTKAHLVKIKRNRAQLKIELDSKESVEDILNLRYWLLHSPCYREILVRPHRAFRFVSHVDFRERVLYLRNLPFSEKETPTELGNLVEGVLEELQEPHKFTGAKRIKNSNVAVCLMKNRSSVARIVKKNHLLVRSKNQAFRQVILHWDNRFYKGSIS